MVKASDGSRNIFDYIVESAISYWCEVPIFTILLLLRMSQCFDDVLIAVGHTSTSIMICPTAYQPLYSKVRN